MTESEITNKIIFEILERVYEYKQSPKNVARELGFSNEKVKKILKRFPNSKVYKNNILIIARRILLNNESLDKVATEAGVNKKKIIKWLRIYSRDIKIESGNRKLGNLILIFFIPFAILIMFVTYQFVLTNIAYFVCSVIFIFFLYLFVLILVMRKAEVVVNKNYKKKIENRIDLILKTDTMQHDPEGAVSIAKDADHSGGELSLDKDKKGGLSKNEK